MELSVSRLTKRFNDRTAVNGVSMTLTPGVYGLLGANGAGKTTLMRMICGILEPTLGEITYDGRNVCDMGESYRDILGYLPQESGYYPNYTAEKFLDYMSVLKGIEPQTAGKRIKELLGIVGLREFADRRIKSFSGGMKQRLGIAQAMLNDPKLLILDEPTAGLDPKERVRFRNLIADYAGNRIVILSTHIVSDIEAIADRVFLMKDGRFVLSGSVPELLDSMLGKVWELSVPEREAAVWEETATVANLRREGDRVVLRIISENRPAPEAVNCRASLEDLYLFYFPTV